MADVPRAAPLIPGELWARMRAFLADGATGSLTVNVAHGVVTSLEVRERLARPAADRSAPADNGSGGVHARPSGDPVSLPYPAPPRAATAPLQGGPGGPAGAP